MSLLRVLDIAATGMQSHAVRLNTVASNLANAEVAASSENGVYQAKQPVFQSVLDATRRRDSVGQGVVVTEIVEDLKAARKKFEPNHPLADETGHVYYPNINMMDQMVNMMAASREYQTLIEAAKTSNQLLRQTLNMGQ